MRIARLQVWLGDRIVQESSGRPISIGRGRANDLRLEDMRISSQHGELAYTERGFAYRDRNSRNGSFVRRVGNVLPIDDACARAVLVRDGDELLLGPAGDPGAVLRVRIQEKEILDRSITGAKKPAITTTLHFDRVEKIAQRVEDDKEALRCLYKLMTRMAGIADRDELVRVLGDLVIGSFPGVREVTVFLRGDGVSSDFHPVHTQCRGETASGGAATAAVARTLFDHVVAKHEAILFEEGGSGADVEAAAAAGGLRHGILVPLWDRTEVRGLVRVESEQAHGAALGDKELELLTLMGTHAALVLANMEMTANLKQLNEQLVEALHRIDLLNRAKECLGKFAPETVRRLVEESPEHPHLTAADVDATILFLDIGGYTKLTEALDREKVSFLVERYFSAFIDDIYANHGDINETAGDGLMIIFRSTDRQEHARSAVLASLAIRRKTRLVNRELERDSPIEVNMGINTGMVTIGSRKLEGVTGTRWTYTATGLVTNIAARFGAHAVNGQILIGPETATRVRAGIPLRDLGPIPLKNVSKPIPVFEVLDSVGEETIRVDSHETPPI